MPTEFKKDKQENHTKSKCHNCQKKFDTFELEFHFLKCQSIKVENIKRESELEITEKNEQYDSGKNDSNHCNICNKTFAHT